MANQYKKYEPLFGSWYITEEIGKGAYGQVYIIERRELGVVYKSALKTITIPQDKNEVKSIMSDGMTESEVTDYYKTLVHNIVNEFILMSKLKGHSNIVSYEDHLLVEHEDDIGWDILIRMELLTPLVEHTAYTTLTEIDVIKLGIDLCKALEFCRKYDIIHRDIKPENIFIAPSGDYKLGDFGVSKTVEKTRIGLSRKGTYIYMAPEVYKGDPYGATVDIYSLGVVMYKLLNNNRTPFMPEFPEPITYLDREDALAKRINGNVMAEPANGSKELKKIVLKACSYNSEDRFASAEEMRRALEKLLYSSYEKKEDTEVVRKEDNKKHQTVEKKQRNKKVAVISAIIAVLAAVCSFALIPKAPEDIKGIEAEETVYIGETLKPDYVIEPERFADEELEFETDDNKIITVNKRGEISAIKTGETVLTITAGKYSEESLIRVIPKVTDIRNVDKTIYVTEGSSVKLELNLVPDKFSNEKITYKIKNNSIASVSGEGNITAKTPGTTTLTISAGGYSETVTVKVEEYVAPYVPEYNYRYNQETPKKSGNGDGYFNSNDDEYF